MSENSNGYDYLIKLLALGDSGVGKTVRNDFRICTIAYFPFSRLL